MSASTSDPFSGIKNVTFPTLSGFTSGGGDADAALPYKTTYTWSGTGANASGPADGHGHQQRRHERSSSSFDGWRPTRRSDRRGADRQRHGRQRRRPPGATTLTGSFTIGTRTDFSEPQSSTQSGLASSTLTLATAPLAGDVVRHLRSPEHDHGQPRAERVQRLLPLHAHGHGQPRQLDQPEHDGARRHDQSRRRRR